MGLGAAGIHCHGHCRDTAGLGTAGILYAVERCRHTLRLLLGTAGIFGGRALQGYLVVGHCRDTWWWGTAGILGGWALQGYSAVGNCRDTLPLRTAVRLRAEGEDNLDF